MVCGARPGETEVPESEREIPITESTEAGPRRTTGSGLTDLGAQVSALAQELGIGQGQRVAPATPPTGTGANTEAKNGKVFSTVNFLQVPTDHEEKPRRQIEKRARTGAPEVADFCRDRCGKVRAAEQVEVVVACAPTPLSSWWSARMELRRGDDPSVAEQSRPTSTKAAIVAPAIQRRDAGTPEEATTASRPGPTTRWEQTTTPKCERSWETCWFQLW